jgi:pimeloyl-ACP methyl ester carboxylesterase
VSEVRIHCSIAEIAGDLTFPLEGHGPPCVVVVGGTLSHNRDGKFCREGIPSRDALKRLADALSLGGYAVLRYDRPGIGESRTKNGWVNSYSNQARVAASVIRFARDNPRVGPIIAVGESAGAYMLCLAAREGTRADANLFLGAFCGPAEELYEYNFARLVRYAESSPERSKWVGERLRFGLLLGRCYKQIFAAARQGREICELNDDSYRARIDLTRRREELDRPPDRMFRHISNPALVLAGEHDLNVPSTHAHRAVEIMRNAGNPDVTGMVIPSADHSFQIPPEDDDLRFRERYTFESFLRPYHPGLYRTILDWLGGTFPTGIRVAPLELDRIASRPTSRA